MTPDAIRGFCEYWYERNACPGCGAALTAVAGESVGHYLPGQEVRDHGPRSRGDTRITAPGELWSGGVLKPTDPRLCRWTADQLAALAHIGSGMVTVR